MTPNVRILTCLIACGALQAQNAPTKAEPVFEATPKIELNVEERIRMEDMNNLLDHLDTNADGKTQYRFRTRLWSTFSFGNRLSFCVGLANENKSITRPEAQRQSPSDRAGNPREIFFETLYLDFKFNHAWSVRVGRQNLMRGEGFILFDGSALDGSRSAYFNAVDLAYAWSNSKLELLAISDPTRDTYLPRINESSKPKEIQHLNEWDERALGAYLTFKEIPNLDLQAYVFRKTETNDYRNPIAQPDRKINTLGARAQYDFTGGWTLSGELARQCGIQDASAIPASDEKDISAWAGYGRVKKTFDAASKPSLSLGYIALSGDNPNTHDKLEGWDPLFSRWPKWSELYIYALAKEGGVAYWTNMNMLEAEFRIQPWKPLTLRGTYYYLEACRNWEPNDAAFYGKGKKRGNLYQVRADLAFGKAWKAHALYERLACGSFYNHTDPGRFMRLEVSYLFNKAF